MPGQAAFWNREFRCEFANDNYLRWFGRKREDILGSHLRDLIGEDYFQMRLPYLIEVLRGTAVSFETAVPTNRSILLHYVPHQDESGTIVGFFVVFSDLTAIKQTHEALKQSEQNLKSAFEDAAVCMGMGGLDPGAPFRRVNRAMCNFLGYSEEELLTKSVRDITYTEDLDEDLGNLQRLLNGTIQNFSMEKRYIHKKGHLIWGQLHVSLVRNTQGEPMHFIKQVVDITERKRLEAAFRQSQKMEVVGRLAGGVAHDFNNILTAMLMSLEEFTSQKEPKEISQLDEVRNLCNQGAQLTRQLLEFARQRPLKKEVFELNSRINRLLQLIHRLIGQNITTNFFHDQDALWVEGDPNMLDQVIMNLCVNARDAMLEGGELTLKTKLVEFDPEDPELPGERRPGSFVCISVADNGSGIEPKLLTKIFEPFFTTKPTGKGSGLGLASAFGIIHQHRGWIEVSSEYGYGSEFRIYVPLSSPSASSLGLPKPISTEIKLEPIVAEPRHQTILLVEDHDLLRRGSTRILEQKKYRVITAHDGPDALKEWEKCGGQIDLLITDMMMPNGISGLQLQSCLLDLKPTLKTILVSGYSEEILTHGFEPKKDYKFLAKPFEPSDLIKLVVEMIGS